MVIRIQTALAMAMAMVKQAKNQRWMVGGEQLPAPRTDHHWSLIHPTKNLSTAFPPKAFLNLLPIYQRGPSTTKDYEPTNTRGNVRQRSDMSWSTVSVFTPSSHALKHRRVIALIQYYLIRCYNIKLQYIADNNIECLIFIRIYIQQ
jgi:hypothetical protein